LYPVYEENGGAHEPYGVFSVWDSEEKALRECDRLNAEYRAKYGTDTAFVRGCIELNASSDDIVN